MPLASYAFPAQDYMFNDKNVLLCKQINEIKCKMILFQLLILEICSIGGSFLHQPPPPAI